ncbi:MAG: hypothetical protein WCV50_02920 [Patescibacteria group bacterium]
MKKHLFFLLVTSLVISLVFSADAFAGKKHKSHYPSKKRSVAAFVFVDPGAFLKGMLNITDRPDFEIRVNNDNTVWLGNMAKYRGKELNVQIANANSIYNGENYLTPLWYSVHIKGHPSGKTKKKTLDTQIPFKIPANMAEFSSTLVVKVYYYSTSRIIPSREPWKLEPDRVVEKSINFVWQR